MRWKPRDGIEPSLAAKKQRQGLERSNACDQITQPGCFQERRQARLRKLRKCGL